MDSLAQRTKSNGHGQVMIEFALVFPILLLLAVGTMDLARAVYAYGVISNAARHGAHFGSLLPLYPPGDPQAGELNIYGKDGIVEETGKKAVGLDPKKLTIPAPLCTRNLAPDHTQYEDCFTSWNWITVTVSYEFQPMILPFASFSMSTQSTMTIE